MRKKIFWGVSIYLGLGFFSVLADFLVPFISHLNLVSLYFGTATAILLFYFSFTYIDSKSIERSENQEKIASIMLSRSYLEVIKMENMLNRETIEKYVVPKCDFNSAHDPLPRTLSVAPFVYDSEISSLALQGVIDCENYRQYLDIKAEYAAYIFRAITFFDAPDLVSPQKERLDDLLAAIKISA